MQNKRYKCVKKYPDGPKVGTIVKFHERVFPEYFDEILGIRYTQNVIETNKEYWQEVKLEVPIGTKFQHCSTKRIYTIDSIEENMVKITWTTGGSYYTFKEVNDYFRNSTWIIYKEKEFEILHLEFSGKILSVKRVIDGAIFHLKDLIKLKDGELKGILGFRINNTFCQVELSSRYCLDYLANLDEIQPYKQPLFFDKLGNEVFEGDTYYFIVDNDRAIIPNAWEVREHIVDWNNPKKPMLGKVQFKYKKDADKWLIDNKPTFSKKQVGDLLKDLMFTSTNYWEDKVRIWFKNPELFK